MDQSADQADKRSGDERSEMNQSPTTILVVDDDPGIQRLAAQLLRSEGYNVLVAADTVEALDVSDAYPSSIDILLTDIMLPSGNASHWRAAPRKTAGRSGPLYVGFYRRRDPGGPIRGGTKRRISREALPGADARRAGSDDRTSERNELFLFNRSRDTAAHRPRLTRLSQTRMPCIDWKAQPDARNAVKRFLR